MMGLPHQEDKDVQEAKKLISQVKNIVKKVGGRVTISVNQFVPKPRTPMEMYPLMEEEEVAEKIKRLQSFFYKDPAVKFLSEPLKEVKIQAFLCRGNRKWGKYLENFYQKSTSNISKLISRLRKEDPSVEKLIYKPVPKVKTPPWRIIKPIPKIKKNTR